MVSIREKNDELTPREQLDFLRGLSETMPESIMITTTEDCSEKPTILYVNQSFSRLTGFQPTEVIGRTPGILQGHRTDRGVLDRLKVNLKNQEPFHGRTFNYRKNGEEFVMDWEIVPFHTPNGNRSFYLTIQREADVQSD
ncbi:MAG: PAS domain S-box protein [Verrucomicrobiota bacterium]